ncbi:MAG: ubiG 1 [Frankiales bacterium]|nr:ubiG 1 [Frankiales bacterium]
MRVDLCPCCGATTSDPLAFGPHDLRSCVACGAVRSSEVHDPSEVYGDDYHQGADGFFVDTDAPGLHGYLQRAYAHRLGLLEGAAPGPGRLLDVGCARGDFLVTARDAGWDVTGVELVASAAAAARERHGLDVRAGLLADAGLEPASFDLVCGFHVVEHVPDATAFVRELASYVRPGGHVAVEVPNWGSLLRRRQGPQWVHLRPREHVTHFTAATLTDTLRRAGLRTVRLMSPSYTGATVEVGQALADVGLRELAAPLTRLDRTAAGPQVRRGIRWVERGLSQAHGGVVLLAVAQVP